MLCSLTHSSTEQTKRQEEERKRCARSQLSTTRGKKAEEEEESGSDAREILSHSIPTTNIAESRGNKEKETGETEEPQCNNTQDLRKMHMKISEYICKQYKHEVLFGREPTESTCSGHASIRSDPQPWLRGLYSARKQRAKVERTGRKD